MAKYAIVVEYIGTNYAGSQIQPNQVTIQSELERALGTLIKSGLKAPLNMTFKKNKGNKNETPV